MSNHSIINKYFTKLDIRWGYNNIRIKEGDKWKAAFITNKGLFEPTVMFFGLHNSPATFQAMMDNYFRDMIDKGWITIYMDDNPYPCKDKERPRGKNKESTPMIKRTRSLLETRKMQDRKSTRLNSSHLARSRMPSSA